MLLSLPELMRAAVVYLASMAAWSRWPAHVCTCWGGQKPGGRTAVPITVTVLSLAECADGVGAISGVQIVTRCDGVLSGVRRVGARLQTNNDKAHSRSTYVQITRTCLLRGSLVKSL